MSHRESMSRKSESSKSEESRVREAESSIVHKVYPPRARVRWALSAQKAKSMEAVVLGGPMDILKSMAPGIKANDLAVEKELQGMWNSKMRRPEGLSPENPGRNERGLLTCQLVSGRPEICIRKMVRRGRGTPGRSRGLGKFSLRRGPRANCTVSRSPLKSLPSATASVKMSWMVGLARTER